MTYLIVSRLSHLDMPLLLGQGNNVHNFFHLLPVLHSHLELQLAHLGKQYNAYSLAHDTNQPTKVKGLDGDLYIWALHIKPIPFIEYYYPKLLYKGLEWFYTLPKKYTNCKYMELFLMGYFTWF